MTEMIERVARILCEAANLPAAINGQNPDSEPNWQPFTPTALDVIDALREPTQAMKAVGAEFFEEGDPKQNGFAAAIVYGAMIDAALNENGS